MRCRAVDVADLRTWVMLESLAAAHRLAPLEIRTEAERQRALERAGRRLGKCRVHDRGPRRIADEDRTFVALHAVLLLHEVRERLESRGEIDTGVARCLESLAHLVDVDAGHECARLYQPLRHANDAEVPAAVARHEDHEFLGSSGRVIGRDAAERRIGDRLRHERGCGEDRQHADQPPGSYARHRGLLSQRRASGCAARDRSCEPRP